MECTQHLTFSIKITRSGFCALQSINQFSGLQIRICNESTAATKITVFLDEIHGAKTTTHTR